MTHKNFHFDFNEDADPVEELHRLRIAATRHFKTVDAIMEYHRSTPPVKEIIAELDREIAEKRANNAQSPKAKASKKSPGRRKNVTHPLHA